MEAALVKALEAFGPAAIIIGIPCGWVIRVLWKRLGERDTYIVGMMEKTIEARILGTAAIVAITEAVKGIGAKMDALSSKWGP